jgi:hypothetical protein
MRAPSDGAPIVPGIMARRLAFANHLVLVAPG